MFPPLFSIDFFREGRGEHDNPDLERSDGNRASDAIMEGANSRRAGGQKDEEKKDKVSVGCCVYILLTCTVRGWAKKWAKGCEIL